MGTFLDPADLEPFAEIEDAKAEAMIADAEALAIAVAPCLIDEEVELTPQQLAAVKAVLRSAILRWNDQGTGAYQQQVAGPFSVAHDTRQARRSLFWPSEIEQLQSICTAATGGSGTGAFAIDTYPGQCATHADICSLNFGATYCSCGAVLAGVPLYEVEP